MTREEAIAAMADWTGVRITELSGMWTVRGTRGGVAHAGCRADLGSLVADLQRIAREQVAGIDRMALERARLNVERQVAAPPADPRLTLLRELDAHFDALVAERYTPTDIAAYDQLTGRLFGIADGSLNPLTPQEREDAMRLAGIGALQAARDRYRAAILAADATPNSIDITIGWPE